MKKLTKAEEELVASCLAAWTGNRAKEEGCPTAIEIERILREKFEWDLIKKVRMAIAFIEKVYPE